jgi:hypothetical protein
MIVFLAENAIREGGPVSDGLNYKRCSSHGADRSGALGHVNRGGNFVAHGDQSAPASTSAIIDGRQ